METLQNHPREWRCGSGGGGNDFDSRDPRGECTIRFAICFYAINRVTVTVIEHSGGREVKGRGRRKMFVGMKKTLDKSLPKG